jgi:hypothetical protein
MSMVSVLNARLPMVSVALELALTTQPRFSLIVLTMPLLRQINVSNVQLAIIYLRLINARLQPRQSIIVPLLEPVMITLQLSALVVGKDSL